MTFSVLTRERKSQMPLCAFISGTIGRLGIQNQRRSVRQLDSFNTRKNLKSGLVVFEPTAMTPRGMGFEVNDPNQSATVALKYICIYICLFSCLYYVLLLQKIRILKYLSTLHAHIIYPYLSNKFAYISCIQDSKKETRCMPNAHDDSPNTCSLTEISLYITFYVLNDNSYLL